MTVEVETYPDAFSLARAAAEQWVALAQAAIADHGRFSVALSGGSTPRTLYSLLATRQFAPQVDWPHVYVFWGDERCVPPDHLESNYRMARETLLDHVPISPFNIHRIPCEQEPEQAAITYERTLRTFFVGNVRKKSPLPCFDLVLLGMGDDGHTASLFPGSAALDEPTRWVAANYVDKIGAWRVTLTPPVLNAATHVTFLVSGAGKAERLREVLTGPYQPDVLPAQIIRPIRGRLVWLVDAAVVATHTSA